MSKLKLEYEILISGIYPFEGTLQKQGFTFSCLEDFIEQN